jgi:hypothetical protein
MHATDDLSEPPAKPIETTHAYAIVLGTVLVSFALVVASLFLHGVTGWNAASAMVSRLCVLLFVAAMVVEPLARLIPSRTTQAMAQERGAFLLAFAAADVTALACLLMPDGGSLSTPTIAYCLLTGAILVVLLFSSHPATMRLLGGPAWRAMQRVALGYFWVVLALVAIGHLMGPRDTGAWYGFSLLLLVGAVLVRFADAFAAQYRALAQKVG